MVDVNKRQKLWALRVHQRPWAEAHGLSAGDQVAGFFYDKSITLSPHTVLEDLKIIYPRLKEPPESFVLSLWVQGSNKVTFIYDNGPHDERVFTEVTEWVGVCFHTPNNPGCPQGQEEEGIKAHLKESRPLAGCAQTTNVVFDADANGFMPYDVSYGIPTARLSRPSTPTKRQRTTTSRSSGSPGSSSPSTRQVLFASNLIDSLKQSTRDFEGEIKVRYNECVITRTNSRFGGLECGPGYVAAHLVPQKLWYSQPPHRTPDDFEETYPINVVPKPSSTDEAAIRARMARNWSNGNGIVLRADVHDIFDRRLIAIHPVTNEIRVFAPMAVVAHLHRTKVVWPVDGPDKQALAYHYQQCVIENAGAGWTLSQRDAVTSAWQSAVGTIARSMAYPLPPVFETGIQGLDGANDAESSCSSREQEIQRWLQTFNLEG
ncbi:hypothetical protein ABW21_db0207840 [Orbilia brochopaga]|nr:hypothetical protein ABW21_db0207840 [Drechslerella brochopaga]